MFEPSAFWSCCHKPKKCPLFPGNHEIEKCKCKDKNNLQIANKTIQLHIKAVKHSSKPKK